MFNGKHKPAEKSQEVSIFLDKLSGRTKAINNNGCTGLVVKDGKMSRCDQADLNFKNEVSRREYTISGMCQTCQDNFFEGVINE
tara:strand:+ start:1821 stop:2072 length:252 start_codon:yes stop_codon:yes gene_type:complete